MQKPSPPLFRAKAKESRPLFVATRTVTTGPSFRFTSSAEMGGAQLTMHAKSERREDSESRWYETQRLDVDGFLAPTYDPELNQPPGFARIR